MNDSEARVPRIRTRGLRAEDRSRHKRGALVALTAVSTHRADTEHL